MIRLKHGLIAAQRPIEVPELVEHAHPDRGEHRPLEHVFRHVVPARDPGAGIRGAARGGEHVLPNPRLRRVRVLAVQGVGEIDRAVSGCQVFLVQALRLLQLPPQRLHQRMRQHAHPVLLPLPLTDGELEPGKVEVLDPQPDALHQPQPTAVEEARHQARCPVDMSEDGARLFAGEHLRQSRQPLRPLHVLNGGQLDVEDVPVEEKQSAERDVLGGGGDVLLHRQVRKERADLGGARLLRMGPPPRGTR
jgi:hypothetical protein